MDNFMVFALIYFIGFGSGFWLCNTIHKFIKEQNNAKRT